MTKQIYMDNSYLTELNAKILLNREVDGKFHLILDKTIFYPDGVGGQRGDIGTINGIAVENAFITEGKVVHVTKSKVAGSEGLIKIDWNNRLHIMQQHTSQHLTSACFHRLYKIPTLSFHASDDFITIDLDIDELSKDKIVNVEDLANRIIQNNLPIKHYFPDSTEIKNINFRRKPKVFDDLRVVEIDGVDIAACGGTHVKSAGELGLVKIIDSNKQNGKTRIIVASGLIALKDYTIKNDLVHFLGKEFSANEKNLIDKYNKQKTIEEKNHEKYNLLKNNYFDLLKKSLLEDLDPKSKLIICSSEKIDFEDASEFSKKMDTEDLILAIYEKDSEITKFLVKVCGNLPYNLDNLRESLKANFNLKDGGNSKLLQGLILNSAEANIHEFFERELS